MNIAQTMIVFSSAQYVSNCENLISLELKNEFIDETFFKNMDKHILQQLTTLKLTRSIPTGTAINHDQQIRDETLLHHLPKIFPNLTNISLIFQGYYARANEITLISLVLKFKHLKRFEVLGFYLSEQSLNVFISKSLSETIETIILHGPMFSKKMIIAESVMNVYNSCLNLTQLTIYKHSRLNSANLDNDDNKYCCEKLFFSLKVVPPPLCTTERKQSISSKLELILTSDMSFIDELNFTNRISELILVGFQTLPVDFHLWCKKNCRDLEELTFHNCVVTSVMLDQILTQVCTHVTALTICNDHALDLGTLSDALDKNTNITSLNLTNCSKISSTKVLTEGEFVNSLIIPYLTLQGVAKSTWVGWFRPVWF